MIILLSPWLAHVATNVVFLAISVSKSKVDFGIPKYVIPYYIYSWTQPHTKVYYGIPKYTNRMSKQKLNVSKQARNSEIDEELGFFQYQNSILTA